MSNVKSPLSLRTLCGSLPAALSLKDGVSAKALGVAAVLASSVGVPALAQDASNTLPPVRVDAPREKPKPVVVAKPKPTPVVAAAKPAPVHRAAPSPASGHHASAPSTPSHVVTPGAGGGGQRGAGVPAVAADANPYADPRAPFKVDRVFSQICSPSRC